MSTITMLTLFLCLCAVANVAVATHDLEIEELKAIVSRQQNIINKLTDKVDYLMHKERTNLGRRVVPETVAFTAYLDHEESVHPNSALKFNKVLYNNGNAYNTLTGIFTVPLDGTYLFTFQIEHWLTQEMSGTLVVDGVNQVSTVISSRGYSTQSGNTAILGVKAGQSVWIAPSEGALFSSPTFHSTVFAGALLM